MLADKIALVTGATRGIGKEIVHALAKEKITVIATSTSNQGVQTIDDYFKKNNFKGGGCLLDVNSDVQRKDLYNYVMKSFNGVDILINNAGINNDNLVLRMKDEEWDDVINTNLKSVFKLSQLFVRNMIRKRWGRIVNISSIVSYTGNFGQANYVASKAGLIGFSKTLALEVAAKGVTVNCVAPGFIDTDMTAQLKEEHKQFMIQHIPMKRVGTPGEVAGVVLFLLEGRASYITGVTIHVNGGSYMA